MKRRIYLRAALALAGLLVFIWLLLILKPPLAPPAPLPTLDRIGENQVKDRSMQTLYQAEAQAAQTGWTADLLRTAGNVWYRVGDLSQAAAYWEAALQQQPGNLSLQRQLADVYVSLERWPAAADMLRSVTQANVDDSRSLYQLGLIEAAYDPREASVHLVLASRDPLYQPVTSELLPVLTSGAASAEMGMRIGMVLAEHHQWGYAELAFEHAAALGDPFPEALAYQGLARDQQGKDGSAQITRAAALAPANPQVSYLQGLHLRTVGDYVGSVNALTQAVNLDPLDPAFAAELGTAYQLVGNDQQAAYWLNLAVSLSNHDPRFQNLLTQFQEQRGSN